MKNYSNKTTTRKTTSLILLLLLVLIIAGCSNGTDHPADTVLSPTAQITAGSNDITNPNTNDTPSDNGDPNTNGDPANDNEPKDTEITGSGLTAKGGIIAEFTKFDQRATWESDAVTISFDEAKSGTTDGVHISDTNKVAVSGKTVTITGNGTYLLSGTTTDGQIVVDVPDQDKVQLVLNGLSLTCTDGPAIYVKNADKVSLTLAPNTENSLADGSVYHTDYDTKINACVCSKDDLSINGAGTLTVNGNFENGIDSSNDIRIISGTIFVTANNHALKGNDSIGIMGGTIELRALNEGMKSDTEDEAGKGYIYMNGGSLMIAAGDDGIQATSSIVLIGGSVSVQAADDRINCDGVTDITIPY